MSKFKRRAAKLTQKQYKPWLNLGLLIFFLLALSQLKIFRIKNVVCKFYQYPCPLLYQPILVSINHQSIFQLDPKQLKTQFQQLDPTLTDVLVKKKLPNKVVIELQRHQPIANLISLDQLDYDPNATDSALTVGSFKASFLLDDSGYLFSDSQIKSDLPQIFLSPSFNLPVSYQPPATTISQLLNLFEQNYQKANHFYFINPNLILVEFDQPFLVLIDPTQPLTKTVTTLQYVLTNIKINQQLPKKIDLRFDQPVLIY